MASSARRRLENASGDFFVDETCIDCGTCRWMAPRVYDAEGEASRVHRQPESGAEVESALAALVACPTGSIGTESRHNLRPIVASFPRSIEEEVYHCGFHSERSFGAASYLIVREAGNVLVDSPRFSRPLVRGIEALGGVSLMFLTHRDDVADHDRFRAHFGCDRILHRRDVGRGTRDVERQLEGDEPIELAGDLLALPVPGHTRGSTCLLYRERFLFSGDHVAWDLEEQEVRAFRGACWSSWRRQIESMERLAERRFSRLLPGHGAPCGFPPEEMVERLRACVAWMRQVA